MSQYDVYGIGAALVDTEIDVNDGDLSSLGVDKGVMTLVDEKRQVELLNGLAEHLVQSKRTSGGSAANTIIAASYFGARNFYSCKVANDDNGELYLADLTKAEVDFHSRNGSNEGITGKCLVMITPDAERSMNTFLGISETLGVADIDESALAASKFAYIEGYLVTSKTGKPAAIKVRELAQKHGVKVALSLSDPAIVQFFHDGIQEMIGEGVELLFCNEAEALNYTKTTSLDEACEALKTYARTFAITLGARGALVFDGTTSTLVAGVKAIALDTNGAGDMFAGAFLYAISEGQTYAQAAALANKAAAVVVSQYGPRLAAEQHTALLKN